MSNETLELTAVANVKPLISDMNAAGNSVKEFAVVSDKSFSEVEKSAVGVTASFNSLKTKGVKSLGDLESQLKSFKDGLNVATSTESIGRLNRAILETERRITSIKKTGTGSFDPTIKGSAQASQAFVNLGRVAQDLPFGFIGIQNNLNPLLESFARLKAETGSGKAAFSALASSLAGPAGIGLALSVVSGAILIAQNGIAGFNKKTKEAKEATDSYAKALEGIASGIANEASKVASLIAVIKSETETRERKNEAIKELNKISPEIFKNLKLEEGAVINIDESYKKYLATLKTVYAAKILQKRLDDEFVKLITLEGGAKTQREKGNRALTESYLKIGEAVEETGRKIKIGGRINFATSLNPLVATRGKIEELSKALQELSSGIKLTPAIDKGGVSKKVKEVKNVVEDEQKQLTNTFRKWRKMRSEENPLPPEVKPEYAKDAFNQEFFDKFLSPAQFELNNRPLFVPIQIKEEGLRALGERTKALLLETRFAEDVTNLFSKTGANAAMAFGEGIAGAISGMENPFSSLLGVLGAAVKELGTYYIGVATLIDKIQKAIKLKPALAIPFGIALVAIGSLISSAANQKLKGFATGVQNFQGGVAMVGERGPELVNLPRGADVIPNYQLAQSSIGGGQSLEVTGEFVLRNDSLVMAVRRGTNTMLKTG